MPQYVMLQQPNKLQWLENFGAQTGNFLGQLMMMKIAHNMRMDEQDREIEQKKAAIQEQRDYETEKSSRPPEVYELGGQKFIARGGTLLQVKDKSEQDKTVSEREYERAQSDPAYRQFLLDNKRAGALIMSPYQQESIDTRRQAQADTAQQRKEDSEWRRQYAQDQQDIRKQQIDEKKQVGMAKDASLQRMVEYDLNSIDATVDKLLKHPGLDNITGYIGAVPITVRRETKDAQALLEKIKSNLVVSTLQNMRAASVNGSSGMGQLSDRENKVLEQKLAALQEATSKDQIVSELNGLKEWSKTLRGNMRQTFEETWSGRAPNAQRNEEIIYKSPEDVKDAFRAKKLSRDEALKILNKQFGMEL